VNIVDYHQLKRMNNKFNIHKLEELGFFIAMAVASIVIGIAILGGVVLLIDLINK
jgi:hypothetical protein